MDDRILLDLHIHSKYSYDSFLSPGKIIHIAKKRRLNAVAITDHDTMEGSILASSIPQSEVMVIPGMESRSSHKGVKPIALAAETPAMAIL